MFGDALHNSEIAKIFDKINPDNGGFMQTNQITMEYRFKNGSRLPLMLDLIHKMNRSRKEKIVELKPTDSILADSDVIFNYFCNQKLRLENVCCT